MEKKKSNKEQTIDALKVLGLFGGLLLLKLAVDYIEVEPKTDIEKINGEKISDLKKLNRRDIQKRMKQAVEDERYEDAGKLQKLLMYKI